MSHQSPLSGIDRVSFKVSVAMTKSSCLLLESELSERKINGISSGWYLLGFSLKLFLGDVLVTQAANVHNNELMCWNSIFAFPPAAAHSLLLPLLSQCAIILMKLQPTWRQAIEGCSDKFFSFYPICISEQLVCTGCVFVWFICVSRYCQQISITSSDYNRMHWQQEVCVCLKEDLLTQYQCLQRLSTPLPSLTPTHTHTNPKRLSFLISVKYLSHLCSALPRFLSLSPPSTFLISPCLTQTITLSVLYSCHPFSPFPTSRHPLYIRSCGWSLEERLQRLEVTTRSS